MNKNLLFYKTYFAFCLCIIALVSCDSWPTDLKAYVDQESKDYCLFGIGSYWVYQDSVTLETDSVVIYDVEITHNRHANPRIAHLAERYGIYMNYYKGSVESKIQYTLSSYFVEIDSIKKGIHKPIICMPLRGVIAEGVMVMGQIYHNGDIGEAYEIGSPKVKYETFFPDFQVGDKSFSNVKVFTSTRYKDTDYHAKIYWAEYIGLIREEIRTTNNVIVRNLIEHNVKPYKK